MDTTQLRQKLHHYIENTEEKKLQAIFLNVPQKHISVSDSALRARGAIKQQSK